MAKQNKRKNPQIIQTEDYHKVVAELFRQGLPDRAFAIIRMALLDQALEHALKTRLVRNAESLDHLFDPDGPVGPTSAKIYLAHALGLLSERNFANLKTLNKIRNRFAHALLLPGEQDQLQAIAFKTPEIARLCSKLAVPLAAQPHKFKWKRGEPINLTGAEPLPVPTDPKQQFHEAANYGEMTLLSLALNYPIKINIPKDVGDP